MKAIITDAGFASRYLPITKTIPKAMIPIGAKPVMQLCVEECVAAGIDEIIIVVSPGDEEYVQEEIIRKYGYKKVVLQKIKCFVYFITEKSLQKCQQMPLLKMHQFIICQMQNQLTSLNSKRWKV